MAIPEAPKPFRDEKWVREKTLDIVGGYPTQKWHTEPQLQEIDTDVHCAVTGYRTTIEVQGGDFVIWLEKVRVISPENMRAPENLYVSPYRIRIARSVEDERVEIGFIDINSKEHARLKALYEWLDQEVGSPDRQKKKLARADLLTNFDAAIIATDTS